MTELRGAPEDVAFFELMDSHAARAVGRMLRMLPGDPRCHVCHAPYGGMGGRIVRRMGFAPSRKNPNLCNNCFEKAPMGGVETEVGVFFADVRGFTATSESMPPGEVADMLNRFYREATAILSRHAIIDKLVGDEVMALYFPYLLAERWGGDMVADAQELVAKVRPWLRVGVGLDVGTAYVGNVGAGEVKDFTAIGDVVNTAARLQSRAREGQIVMSERVYDLLTEPPECAPAELELKGKSAAERVRVITMPAG